MSESIKNKRLKKLVQRIDPQSRLIRAWRLTGGISAQVTTLEIEHPQSGTKKLIVRRHGERDLQQNPNVATDEFRLLQILQSAEIAAPVPVYLDQCSEIFSTPCLVVEYVEGETNFAPVDLSDCIFQLATHLTRIHTVDATNYDFSFLPNPERRYTRTSGVLLEDDEGAVDHNHIRNTLDAVWPLPQRNESVLLHGDFWPGNILWQGDRLVAVIDWEDAAFGEPLADVANSRLELLWAFGIEAMDSFTRYYQAKMPGVDFSNLPYWDLCVALRNAAAFAGWAEDEASEKTMRDRHSLFINQAFEILSAPQKLK